MGSPVCTLRLKRKPMTFTYIPPRGRKMLANFIGNKFAGGRARTRTLAICIGTYTMDAAREPRRLPASADATFPKIRISEYRPGSASARRGGRKTGEGARSISQLAQEGSVRVKKKRERERRKKK